MSEACSHDCSSCGSDCAEREVPQNTRNDNNKNIKKVIAVVSGKGGVGKSLVTSMLAVKSRREGLKTAVLDADITGPSIPKSFGLSGKATCNETGTVIYPPETKTGIKTMSLNYLLDNETDPVIWRGPVIASAVKQFWEDVDWEDIDCMFIDCPPGTVDVPVLGIVENMSYFKCPDCGNIHYIYGKSNIDETARELGIKTVAKMPIDPEVAKHIDAGRAEELDTAALDGVFEAIKNC